MAAPDESIPAEHTEKAFVATLPLTRRERGVAQICRLYAIGVLGIWLFLRYAGDRSWVGAVITFSPRWIWLLPAVPLLMLAFRYRRRSVWTIACAAAFAMYFVMGFCVPWRAPFSSHKPSASVRFMTYNVHGLAVRVDLLARCVNATKPDIVVLQEWTPPYNPSIFPTGWTVITNGEMCLASRYPVEQRGEIKDSATVRYIVNTPFGNINVFNAHFASPHFPLRDTILGSKNGRSDLETNIAIRTRESRLVSAAARAIDGPVIIAGDFNLPPDSPIFRDHFSGFADAFDERGFGFGLTYFNGWTASRIDHILTTGPLTCRACWLGQNIGSPHRPLIADFSVGKFVSSQIN